MKIILTGSGSGGPVMPLIAVQKKIKKTHPHAEFLFIGTKFGVEGQIVEKHKIKFVSVLAGKWRRYFSLLNFFAPFLVLFGFIQALIIIRKFKPNVVFAAGGYVSVPVILAAWLLRAKIAIHQQDVFPSLSNKILAPIADKITVSFEHSLKDFSVSSGFGSSKKTAHKIIWTGNPVLENVLEVKHDPEAIKKRHGLRHDLPVVLVVGGGTGALGLNNILKSALPGLVKFVQVIHSSGLGKSIDFKHENYHQFEFIDNIAEIYHISDMIIARAGLSTISELSALGKVSIIIPMPDSHQEYNAFILNLNNAALCLNQKTLEGEQLVAIVRKLLHDGKKQKELQTNIHNLMPHNAAQEIAKIITSLCQEKK